MATYLEIVISDHAPKRMRERRILTRQVRRAIAEPHIGPYASKGRLVVERWTTRGNLLRVVYVEGMRQATQIAIFASVIRISGKGKRNAD